MSVECGTPAAECRKEDVRDAHMENLFGWICRTPNFEKGVTGLEDYALRDLLGWLDRTNVLTGIPGMIYGIALVEAAKRFQEQ